ncbi:hypothetical protein HaLaN_17433 [Haematococcus lacustris]|uniref:Uncharacterized protein n=1 Tax=Haematococcus lacustris TaxID=44745 RepID=A0A699ZGL8_HAELA|nr:hypothetical protein HaLaN_17433 [Haematococcus lacustris]
MDPTWDSRLKMAVPRQKHVTVCWPGSLPAWSILRGPRGHRLHIARIAQSAAATNQCRPC